MIKGKFLYFLINFFLIVVSKAHVSLPVNETDTPLLVTEETSQPFPKLFRSTLDIKNKDLPSYESLITLNISGSSQFSEEQLSTMVNTMKGQIYVIDLRQESHGFVNGKPISWYAAHNGINKGFSDQEVKKREKNLLQDLGMEQNLMIYKLLPRSEQGPQMLNPYHISIERIENEEEIVSKKHFIYKRYYVTDHEFPNQYTVDAFLNFVAALPQDAWIHFHCRGGHGRTTTFMILYDILKNGRKLPLNLIMERHARMGGADLRHFKDKSKFPAQVNKARFRLKSIEQFYHYINDPQGYPRYSWSTWNYRNRN